MARLAEVYKNEVAPELMKKYNYKSPRRQHLRKPCDFRSGNDLSDTIPKPQSIKENNSSIGLH